MTGTSMKDARTPLRRLLRLAALTATIAVVASMSSVSSVAADTPPSESKSQSDRPVSPEARYEALIDTLVDAPTPARATSLLYRMDELADLLPVKQRRRLLEQARSKVEYPLAEFAIERRLYRDELNRELQLGVDSKFIPRLLDKKTEFWREGDCLVDWKMVGPFDNDSMDAFNSRLAPERGELGPYDGKNRTIEWRSFPRFARGCHLLVGTALEPASSSVVYLTRTIEADSSGTRRLLIGADGAYRVWVNGQMVAERTKDQGFAVDAQAWKLPLKKGPNRILVKLGSTRTGSLSLMARVLDSELQPTDIPADSASTPLTGGKPELESVDNDGNPSSTGQGRVARIRSCTEDATLSPAHRIDCLVTWSSIEPLNSAEPWEDVADNLVAPLRNQPGRPRGPFGKSGASSADAGTGSRAKRGGLDAGVYTPSNKADPSKSTDLEARAIARLASVYDSQDDRIDVLRVAHHRADSDPVITLRLARVEAGSLEDTSDHRRKQRLEQIVENHPDMWPASLELANWYATHGYGRRALEMVSSLEFPLKMQRPAVISRQARLEGQYGEYKKARRLSRRAAQINRLHTQWIQRRVDELVSTRQHRTARRLLNQQRYLFPWSVRLAIQRCNVYRAAGDASGALANVESALEDMPGSTRLYRYKAELLAGTGQRHKAVATLETALEYEPQNQRLQDYLAHLQPSEKSFHEPWMIQKVRAEADEQPTSEHSVDTIIDQTVVRVSPNGLSQRVVQVVQRVNNVEGLDTARSESVSFRRGDEYVDVLSVKVHKPDGRVLEEYSEWTSGGSRKGSSYYNDLVYRNIRAQNVEKGDLVEIRYRLQQARGGNFRGDYFGDLAYVQQTRPVGFVRYAVEAPETWELHFNAPESEHSEISQRPGDGSVPEGFRVHGFELRDIPAVNTDPDMPGYTDVYDYLMVSNKETWDEIGDWWWKLIEEQLITSDPIKQKVAELTKGLESDRKKMEMIHNWVVKNTRYLHVGLGVHGWKPYKTTRAFKNKFGDCKDKSSLLKVMLEEAGIRTHLVLVRTRDLGHVEPSPASMHIFNHAITYVPQFDLYLDPTAEFNGTTELTPMDQGAQGLIVRSGGDAEFVTLPVDEPEDNTLRRKLTVDLAGSEASSTTQVTGSLAATGQNAVYYRRSLQDPDRRDQHFEKQLADTYPGATLKTANYQNLTRLEASPAIRFSFSGGRFLRGSGANQYVYPYGTEQDLLANYAKQSERHQDLTIRVPFVNETEITYELPPGKQVAKLPDDVDMTSDFGALRIDYDRGDGQDANQLTVDIRYSLKKQRVPVERYSEFRSFLSKMTTALNQTLTVKSRQAVNSSSGPE